MRPSLLFALVFLVGCQPDDELVVRYPLERAAVYEEFVGFTGDDRWALDKSPAPPLKMETRPNGIAVIEDLDCGDCWSLDRPAEGGGLVVHAGSVVAGQHGLADAFEQMGYGFFHPNDTLVPEDLDPQLIVADGTVHQAERARRGYQPHTLHPIEALYDLWVPEAEHLGRSKRLLDWIAKNRGNHLQYPGLDDILGSGSLHDDWAEHTAAITEAAHARGMTVGVGVQLYGGSNLQRAFDLSELPGQPEEIRPEMDRRLGKLLEGTNLDEIELSFGEFSGVSPEEFVAGCDAAYEAMQAAQPGILVRTVIHVGDTEELRVDYGEDKDLLYYFLVKYANPAMVPLVHTTMYYNLFESAGGAYHHEEFDEHRDYLFERLEAGQPVGYFPESAYWVAFDVNMPVWLPLYIRSRWVDFDGIDKAVAENGWSKLDEHTLFASGWEWGYWQNDRSVLRMSFETPESWEQATAEVFAPLGADGVVLADHTVKVATIQHEFLMEKGLAAYLAGRELTIDIGDGLGIIGQPDRPRFTEIIAMTPDERTAFGAAVVGPLGELRDQLSAEVAALRAEGLSDNRWTREVIDGAEVTALRAGFAAKVFGAAVKLGDAQDIAADITALQGIIGEARVVVDRRHADLHDPEPERLLVRNENPTVYQFGYLLRAEELCFWERELAEIRKAKGDDVDVPACAL